MKRIEEKSKYKRQERETRWTEKEREQEKGTKKEEKEVLRRDIAREKKWHGVNELMTER